MTLGPDHTEVELAEVVLVRGFEEEDGIIDKVLETVWEHLSTTWAELTGHIRLFSIIYRLAWACTMKLSIHQKITTSLIRVISLIYCFVKH